MAGTESKRATVYHKAGAGVRRMEATRWLAALFFLFANADVQAIHGT
jgi:hypothetical protein